MNNVHYHAATLLISNKHPLDWAYGSLVALVIFLLIVAWEAKRQRLLSKELKKFTRKCPHCGNPSHWRRHIKTPMPLDPNHKFFSRWDWLCQTQGKCSNADCPSKGAWYEEKIKIKYFDLFRRLTQFWEFRKIARPEEFVGNDAKLHLQPKTRRPSFLEKLAFQKPVLDEPPFVPEDIHSTFRD